MAASGYDLQTPTDIAHSIRLVSNSDSSLDFDNTRSFEREIRIANDECRGELEETITFLRNESLDSSIQGSIDILLADMRRDKIQTKPSFETASKRCLQSRSGSLEKRRESEEAGALVLRSNRSGEPTIFLDAGAVGFGGI